MGRRLEIKAGERYNRLTILKESAQRGYRRHFLCRCICGTVKEVCLASMRSGAVKSCGCLVKERAQKTSVHGQWNKPIYGVWRDMIQRCTNPNIKNFHLYGGRGIKVCKGWMEAKSFIDWAFANGYDSGLTIDRIDVNGDYSPENCRWVSVKVQQNNKRTNVVIEYKGVRRNLRQWSKITGTNHETLRRRLKEGWSVERALFGENQRGKKYVD